MVLSSHLISGRLTNVLKLKGTTHVLIKFNDSLLMTNHELNKTRIESNKREKCMIFRVAAKLYHQQIGYVYRF